jgi:hypothetical protein
MRGARGPELEGHPRGTPRPRSRVETKGEIGPGPNKGAGSDIRFFSCCKICNNLVFPAGSFCMGADDMIILALIVLAFFTIASVMFMVMIFVLDPIVYFNAISTSMGVIVSLFAVGILLLMSSCSS